MTSLDFSWRMLSVRVATSFCAVDSSSPSPEVRKDNHNKTAGLSIIDLILMDIFFLVPFYSCMFFSFFIINVVF